MNYHSKIKKWGNSLGIRIHKSMADQLNLNENTEVVVTIEDQKLIITPCRKQYTLSSLLDEITEKNLHNAAWTDKSEGKEVW